MNPNNETVAAQTRARQTLTRINSMIRMHERLGEYATRLQVSVENAAIVLRGTLPSQELSRELLPTVRRAGVLWQVKNRVNVARS